MDRKPYTSVLAKFSTEGDLLFLRRPVDPHPDSSVEITESRRIHMVDGSPWSALSLAVDGEQFYVLTMDEQHGERRKYLDAYSLDDGGYRYSYELPPRCTAIDLRGSQLLTVTPEEMTLWNLEETGGQPV